MREGKRKTTGAFSWEDVGKETKSLLHTQTWHQSCDQGPPVSHFSLSPYTLIKGSHSKPHPRFRSQDDDSVLSLPSQPSASWLHPQLEGKNSTVPLRLWQRFLSLRQVPAAALSSGPSLSPMQWQPDSHITTRLPCALTGKSASPTPSWPHISSSLQGLLAHFRPIWTLRPIIGLCPRYEMPARWRGKKKKKKNSPIVMQSEAVLASCARIYNKCVYRAGWLWRRSWACYSWPHSRRQSRRCWWRKCHSIAHKRSPDLQRRERKKKKKTEEEDEEYKHTWIQNFWRVGLHKIWVIFVGLCVCVCWEPLSVFIL